MRLRPRIVDWDSPSSTREATKKKRDEQRAGHGRPLHSRFGGHLPRGDRCQPMPDTKPRRARRQFTDDFKAGAVRLVLDEGKTACSLAPGGDGGDQRFVSHGDGSPSSRRLAASSAVPGNTIGSTSRPTKPPVALERVQHPLQIALTSALVRVVMISTECSRTIGSTSIAWASASFRTTWRCRTGLGRHVDQQIARRLCATPSWLNSAWWRPGWAWPRWSSTT